jgi:type 1 glutamine amidotransferase
VTAARRTALVVRGGWEGHRPVEATELFLPFLREQGFDVRVEALDDLSAYADAELMAATDLVLQCVSTGSITDDQVAGLRAAVRAGTGLAGWHGGIVDSFRSSPDYLQLVGGQFVAHPAKPGHQCTGAASDSFLPHTVSIRPEAADHPVVAGLADFRLETEQYWVLTDGYDDVLATTTHPAREDQPWGREVTCPAVWTRSWGAGRVFVATPGHSLDVLQDPSVRTIVERGLLWASRQLS